MRVKVDNGKYEFFIEAYPNFGVRRGGQPWADGEFPFNAVHSLLHELAAASRVVDAARKMGARAPAEIAEALKEYAGLCSDNGEHR